MSNNSDSTPIEVLIEKIMNEANSPEFKNSLALHHANRTDPWRWYCRLCGAEGKSRDRCERNKQACDHMLTACGYGAHKREEEVGRLLHVWSYGNIR